MRRSIKRDFANANFKRLGHAPKEPRPLNQKRVKSINEKCEYYKYRKYFIGKLIRIVDGGGQNGTWVEFVRDFDRQKLNKAAGWSDTKKWYLLHGARFED